MFINTWANTSMIALKRDAPSYSSANNIQQRCAVKASYSILALQSASVSSLNSLLLLMVSNVEVKNNLVWKGHKRKTT